jgi:hypothetical protein
MLVRKLRNQNKVGKIILTRTEAEIVKKKGITIEVYIMQMLLLIAKKRSWKWFPKEKFQAEAKKRLED